LDDSIREKKKEATSESARSLRQQLNILSREGGRSQVNGTLEKREKGKRVRDYFRPARGRRGGGEQDTCARKKKGKQRSRRREPAKGGKEKRGNSLLRRIEKRKKEPALQRNSKQEGRGKREKRDKMDLPLSVSRVKRGGNLGPYLPGGEGEAKRAAHS